VASESTAKKIKAFITTILPVVLSFHNLFTLLYKKENTVHSGWAQCKLI